VGRKNRGRAGAKLSGLEKKKGKGVLTNRYCQGPRKDQRKERDSRVAEGDALLGHSGEIWGTQKTDPNERHRSQDRRTGKKFKIRSAQVQSRDVMRKKKGRGQLVPIVIDHGAGDEDWFQVPLPQWKCHRTNA